MWTQFAVVAYHAAVEKLCELLQERWRLRPPSVILSISGSMLDLRLDSSLEHQITQGISAIVRSYRQPTIEPLGPRQ